MRAWVVTVAVVLMTGAAWAQDVPPQPDGDGGDAVPGSDGADPSTEPPRPDEGHASDDADPSEGDSSDGADASGPEVPGDADRDAEMFGDGEDRDAEMFGGGDDDPDLDRTEAEPDSRRPRELELVDVDAFEARLLDANDPLTLGGQMYLRLDYSAFDRGGAEEQPLSSSNLLDLYLDARPNDRVRAFLNWRLVYTPTFVSCDPATEDCAPSLLPGADRLAGVLLDQLWVNFDVGRTVFVTAGRQRIKWGSGRFWNPTDFLNQQALDPLAIFDTRLGADVVKLHLPIESLGWNVYAVANIDSANAPQKVGGAARAELLLGPAEIAVSAGARKGTPTRLGADVSSALWLFDVHVEAGVAHGGDAKFYEGEFDLGTLTLPRELDRSDDWIPQVVTGAEVEVVYSDTDSVFIGGEYFFNDAGYDDAADLYPWLLFNSAFNFFYVGRHYAAAYALLPSPGDWNDWTFTLSGLSNLSDRSVLGRADVRVQALTYLSVNTHIAVHTGARGELRLGFDVPPAPLPGLESGVSIPTQVVDLGVGLTLRL